MSTLSDTALWHTFGVLLRWPTPHCNKETFFKQNEKVYYNLRICQNVAVTVQNHWGRESDPFQVRCCFCFNLCDQGEGISYCFWCYLANCSPISRAVGDKIIHLERTQLRYPKWDIKPSYLTLSQNCWWVCLCQLTRPNGYGPSNHNKTQCYTLDTTSRDVKLKYRRQCTWSKVIEQRLQQRGEMTYMKGAAPGSLQVMITL